MADVISINQATKFQDTPKSSISNYGLLERPQSSADTCDGFKFQPFVKPNINTSRSLGQQAAVSPSPVRGPSVENENQNCIQNSKPMEDRDPEQTSPESAQISLDPSKQSAFGQPSVATEPNFVISSGSPPPENLQASRSTSDISTISQRRDQTVAPDVRSRAELHRGSGEFNREDNQPPFDRTRSDLIEERPMRDAQTPRQSQQPIKWTSVDIMKLLGHKLDKEKRESQETLARFDEQEHRIGTIANRAADLEDALRLSEQNRSKLQEDLQRSEELLKGRKIRVQQLESFITGLGSDMKEAKKRQTELKSTCDDLKKRYHLLQEQCDDGHAFHKDQLEVAIARATKLKQSYTEASLELLELAHAKERVENLQIQLKDMAGTLAEEKDRSSALEQRVKDINNRNVKLLDQLTYTNEEVTGSLKTILEQVASNSTRLEKIPEVQSKLEVLTEISSNDVASQECVLQLGEMLNRVADAIRGRFDAFEESRAKFAQSETSRMNNVQSQILESFAVVQKQFLDINTLQQKYSELTSIVSELREQRSANDELVRINSYLESRSSSLEKDFQHAQLQLQAKDLELLETQNRLDEHQKNLKQLEDQKKLQDEEVENLRVDVQIANEKASKSLDAEFTLEEEATVRKREMLEIRKELAELKSENSNLESNAKETNETVQKFKKQSSALELLRKQIEELQKQLAESQRQSDLVPSQRTLAGGETQEPHGGKTTFNSSNVENAVEHSNYVSSGWPGADGSRDLPTQDTFSRTLVRKQKRKMNRNTPAQPKPGSDTEIVECKDFQSRETEEFLVSQSSDLFDSMRRDLVPETGPNIVPETQFGLSRNFSSAGISIRYGTQDTRVSTPLSRDGAMKSSSDIQGERTRSQNAPNSSSKMSPMENFADPHSSHGRSSDLPQNGAHDKFSSKVDKGPHSRVKFFQYTKSTSLDPTSSPPSNIVPSKRQFERSPELQPMAKRIRIKVKGGFESSPSPDETDVALDAGRLLTGSVSDSSALRKISPKHKKSSSLAFQPQSRARASKSTYSSARKQPGVSAVTGPRPNGRYNLRIKDGPGNYNGPKSYQEHHE